MSEQQTIWPEPHDPSWELVKARLECDAPVWVVNRHPADGRALPGWSCCGECPRCEATLDENGEKP